LSEPEQYNTPDADNITDQLNPAPIYQTIKLELDWHFPSIRTSVGCGAKRTLGAWRKGLPKPADLPVRGASGID
jgi:hypothetical protein